MAVYKMILRDGENPDTSKLHVLDYYCNADTKNQAAEIFDKNFGQKWNVAGPLKIDDLTKVPETATFVS